MTASRECGFSLLIGGCIALGLFLAGQSMLSHADTMWNEAAKSREALASATPVYQDTTCTWMEARKADLEARRETMSHVCRNTLAELPESITPLTCKEHVEKELGRIRERLAAVGITFPKIDGFSDALPEEKDTPAILQRLAIVQWLLTLHPEWDEPARITGIVFHGDLSSPPNVSITWEGTPRGIMRYIASFQSSGAYWDIAVLRGNAVFTDQHMWRITARISLPAIAPVKEKS